MKTILIVVGAAVLLLGLSACAAGSTEAHTAAAGGLIAQFLLGLWHGIIAPVILIVEIINWLLPHVLAWKPRMFEPGAGVAYDIGFLLTVTGGPHIYISGYRRRRVRR